jgi:hypothetical protein
MKSKHNCLDCRFVRWQLSATGHILYSELGECRWPVPEITYPKCFCRTPDTNEGRCRLEHAVVKRGHFDNCPCWGMKGLIEGINK